jgi:uncharacterized NAD-dependent epimerase/dehydratase family protein
MKRYLVLAEGYSADPHYGKTARGVMRYGADPVVAVVDSERSGESLDGVPVVASVEEALGHEPTTALVGVATAGGRLPEKWRDILRSVLAAGLDLESGMHQFLGDDFELAALAEEHGAEIRDLRRAPPDLSVPTGENLEHGATVVLTVGSDCAIGKMSVALELDRGARQRGARSVFVPTGQTGIAIAGWGIAVDAVVADFIAGAAERLVVEGARRGDLLWVEGQGSLIHPDYSGVTLPRERPAPARSLPPGRGRAHPGSSGTPDSASARAHRAARADCASRPSGESRGRRTQYAEARRRACPGGDSGGRGGDRIARRRPCPVRTWPFGGGNPVPGQSGIRQA